MTVDEIFEAKELYCSDCCLSCDECGMKDFFDFELLYLIEKIRSEKSANS